MSIKWTREELILVLDLYLDIWKEPTNQFHPKIIELAEILTLLQAYTQSKPGVRTPDAVSFKLNSFLSLDNRYEKQGVNSTKLARELWNEFHGKREHLSNFASKIKNIARMGQDIGEIEAQDVYSANEGKIFYRLHKLKERDSKLILLKKKDVLKKNGRLFCEVCNFNFEDFYGEIGQDFIECHHKKPISELKLEDETTLDDLAVVCSNCHRMLHRKKELLSIEELRKMLVSEK